MLKTTLSIIVLTALFLPGEAQAYLDPGTGSALLQMAIAGIMGGLFILKTYWRKLIGLFSSKTVDEAEATSTSLDDEND